MPPESSPSASSSCAFPPSKDVVAFARAAEELGYQRVWLYDSPALYGDVWITLARIAMATNTIGLGVGVAVAPLRHPMVTASAIATIEELAPGRLVTALGTGYTGREAMGQRPMRWADLASYIDQVRGLLLGDDVVVEGAHTMMLHGRRHAPARPIASPIWAAPSGPKGFDVARRLGVPGVITPMPPTSDVSVFDNVALQVFGTVLRADEDADSPRVRDALGPMIATVFHGLLHADPEIIDARPGGRSWRLDLERKWPEDRRHFAHAGHLSEVTDLDRSVVEAAGSEILKIGWSGNPAAISQRRQAAAEAGITEVVYGPMGSDILGELEAFASTF